MRKLKFRQPRMAKGKFCHWHYWGYVDDNKGHFVAPLPPNTGGDSYQQTGLKDKNGKEDYDGNIWEVEYRGKKHRFSHKSELGWEGYIFSFKCLTGKVSPVHANVEEDGIIIGDIHTTPKLMEK